MNKLNSLIEKIKTSKTLQIIFLFITITIILLVLFLNTTKINPFVYFNF